MGDFDFDFKRDYECYVYYFNVKSDNIMGEIMIAVLAKSASDRIKINGVCGIVTEAKKTESFVTARMDDDGLLLIIDRSDLEII